MNTRLALYLTALILSASSVGLLYAAKLRPKPKPDSITPVVVDSQPEPQLPVELEPTEVKLPKFKTPDALLSSFEKNLFNEKPVQTFQPSSRFRLTSAAMQQVRQFRALALDEDAEVKRTEVGDLESSKAQRWELSLPSGESLILDLEEIDAHWVVRHIRTAEQTERTADALTRGRQFLRALLEQDYDFAVSLVKPDTVSYARLAGLCIMLEESAYTLPDTGALRAMFSSDLRSGFYVTFVNSAGEKAGNAGLVLGRESDNDGWQVTELALDELLSSYADKVAEGDTWFSPFVSNPEAGDTLVVYFDFDDGQLSDRTRQQLDLVASLLATNRQKQITLTGHTDALGDDDYNLKLSWSRAQAVQTYLTKSGVRASQIQLKAMGAQNPRRPNLTDTGQDNPLGRRANRRTEVYLNF